jgi:hypothetical protein
MICDYQYGEMQSRHVQEKRRLPRILKNEAKTRAQMFKQSLRLSVVGSPEDDRSKMKQVCSLLGNIFVKISDLQIIFLG